MGSSDTLLVRHLPSKLSEEETGQLLEHFGAVHVKCMGTVGRFRHTAFARFKSIEDAEYALSRLHQLKVMGQNLSVEFARGQEKQHLHISDSFCSPVHISLKDSKFYERVKKNYQKFQLHLNVLAPKLNMEIPVSPALKYSYPPPSPSIITNIANTLASVPRLYTQVLHLMNKMNLPAPFQVLTPAPPLCEQIPLLAQKSDITSSEEVSDEVDGKVEGEDFPVEEVEMEVEGEDSTEESELESEDEPEKKTEEYVPIKRPMKPRKKIAKRPKLMRLQQSASEHAGKRVQKPLQPSQVFEPLETVNTKKLEVKILPVEMKADQMSKMESYIPVEGGFGMFAPTDNTRQAVGEERKEEQQPKEDSEFISSRVLKENSIKEKDMKILPVFKNYTAGHPSPRLYIKNLARQVETKDLTFIYGRYVQWSSEEECNMFDVRLMKEGRMKGQAFITLPSSRKAQEALKETNGYILKGKPMVVQFARSAKPKTAGENQETKSND